ncbi:hypothetical protein Sjap_004927 [Stephania japonica]|uniref:PPPDE domain-containing protein n=1 Tax=Stephania japonica TaxID=461633 RepID=A0AAP0K4E7_9MAGN
MAFKKGFRWLKKVVFKIRGDLGNALAEAEEEVLEKRDGTPKDQLSSIKQTLKELQCKREERMKEFCDIQSQIIQLHEALHDSVVDEHIVDDKDLITKRLRELKLVLEGLQSEKAARTACVPVILDAGGMDGLIPVDLLTNVDIFSPNETELEHLTRMPMESFEQISQSVAKIHEMKRNPRFVLVNLNVYDLHPINGSIYWLGLGLYHSGIQVHGVEYEFGGHDSPSTSIFRGKPRECPGLTFRKSILIGRTDLGTHEVHKFMEDLSKSYTGTSYNLITKNCNHFCNDVNLRLIGKRITHWINRLAKIGEQLLL